MPTHSKASHEHFRRLLEGSTGPDDLKERLQPTPEDLPDKFNGGTRISPATIDRRWERLAPEAREHLVDAWTLEHAACFSDNIENFVGTIKIPVGIVGPLRVNGLSAHGDYMIPLATTEAALVASYHRGAQLLTAAGGPSVAVVSEAVSRSPAFAFDSLADAGLFVYWALNQLEEFQRLVSESSNYAKLLDMGTTIEGNHVYLNMEFTTGDASGQNMVTIASQRIYDYILASSPVKPKEAYIEGNLSGDKKASAQAFTTVRGKKVVAEAHLSGELIAGYLHTTPKEMTNYWRMSAMGGVLSGTMGVQGHYANGLTALYLACGQDPACVAESAMGITRFEETADGGMYAAVTLPNIVVGTVGGGTSLPTQRACLDLMDLFGVGKSRALAEVCGALILAGELSIIGAMAAGHFSRAHEKRARRSKQAKQNQAKAEE